jgi:hypothetical protein
LVVAKHEVFGFHLDVQKRRGVLIVDIAGKVESRLVGKVHQAMEDVLNDLLDA